MKILMLSDLWLPFPGGAERYMRNIAIQLADKGHEMTVLTSYFNAKESDPRIKLIIRDIGVYERHPLGLDVIKEELAKATPDLLLTHHFFAHEFRAELPDFNVPFVQMIYNSPRHPQARLAVYISQHAYANSNPSSQDLIIHPPAFGDIVADTHGDCIGMIKPIKHKGIEFVYEIAQALPHRKFMVLKGEWETFNIIKELPNVWFMNPVEDMRDFYRQCKLILMPSLSEDAGTVAQEAAMNKMPCISSNTMGLRETNAGGIVFPLPLNLRQWTRTIEQLLTDDAYYQQIVDRQTEYLAKFGWEQKFDTLNKFLLGIAR